MKYFHLLLFAILPLLCSCNRNNEPPLYVQLPIVSELEPQSKLIDWGNMTSEERQHYPRKGFVINSIDEFPTESDINMTDLKLMDIDFTKYTLLVHYILVPGYIAGHHYSWVINNAEDQYEFLTNFRIVSPEDYKEEDLFTYYRSAILVNKILPNKKVEFFASY